MIMPKGMRVARGRLLCLVLMAAIFLLSCSLGRAASPLPPFDAQAVPPAPDYTREASWLALPSDPDRFVVDVFWVYPTILHDETHWLMDGSMSELRAAAAGTIESQASVFTGQANLYAPLYRQMNMAALTLSDAERMTIGSYGKDDVWRAFNHYLTHYNNGRPFILAGHSQGSSILTELAVAHWGGLGAEERLVAAYILGWSITDENLRENSTLTMCASADQTGCFLGYNTVAAGRQGAAPTIIKGAIVVNPLTWKLDGTKAPASRNLGATFFAADGTRRTYPGFTSAQVKDSGLVVDPADPSLVDSGSGTFPKGVYHVFDYSLFYENLRENVARRIQAFLTKD